MFAAVSQTPCPYSKLGTLHTPGRILKYAHHSHHHIDNAACCWVEKRCGTFKNPSRDDLPPASFSVAVDEGIDFVPLSEVLDLVHPPLVLGAIERVKLGIVDQPDA